MREILLIDADSHLCRGLSTQRTIAGVIELVRGAGATLSLASVELRISMAELYEGIAIATPDTGRALISDAPASQFKHARSPLFANAGARRQPPCDGGAGGDFLRRELVLSDPARHPADPDDPGAAAAGLAARRGVHARLGRSAAFSAMRSAISCSTRSAGRCSNSTTRWTATRR